MLLWCDCETDGLNPDKHVILELAICVTDDELQVVVSKTWVVGFVGERQVVELRRLAADPCVREMHDQNGLWRECAESNIGLYRITQEAIGLIEAAGAEKAPMAGNSVSFDRSFLHRHAPDLLKSFGYRSVDVSTLTELARRWYPAVYQAYEDRKKTKGQPHRALPDIYASIELLKFYRETVLR